MNGPTQQKFTCPSCQLEQEFEIWQNLNVTLEPTLKRKLIRRELMAFTCQGCGKRLRIRHAMLYHDADGKFMVWLPHGENQKPAPTDESVVMSLMVKNGYRFRQVESLNELLEKIRIFEEKQDDRAVELLKFDFLERTGETAGSKLFYGGIADGGGGKVVRFVELRKDGSTVYELPLTELRRQVALLGELPNFETKRWSRVDRSYACDGVQKRRMVAAA